MKKILIILVVLLLFTACSTSKTTEDKTTSKITNNEDQTSDNLDNGVDTSNTEFCIAGQSYTSSQDGATSTATIQGFETYQGKKYCKGTAKTTVQGMDITSTYYFTKEGEDVWVISNVAGQTTETHIVDGEVVN